MRALLLAAGLGTRLRPLTEHFPKCMVPIHGRPLLDYWLESLVAGGIERILINTHYLPAMVQRYLDNTNWMPWVSLVYEEELLGTGGTLLRNRDFFGNQPLLVAHADNLTVFDVHAFIDTHAARPSGAEMTMMLFEADDPRSCGIVELDSDAGVIAFHEKVAQPPGRLANGAVYIFEASIFDRLQAIGKSVIDLSTEVIPSMVGKIASFRNESYHRDIGTIASWRQAHQDFQFTHANPVNAQAWEALLREEPGDLRELVSRLLRESP